MDNDSCEFDFGRDQWRAIEWWNYENGGPEGGWLPWKTVLLWDEDDFTDWKASDING